MADIRVISCQYHDGVVTVKCSYTEVCDCGKDVSDTGTGPRGMPGKHLFIDQRERDPGFHWTEVNFHCDVCDKTWMQEFEIELHMAASVYR
jgi:hypothetical protein